MIDIQTCDENELLALCVWREARGESFEAQRAVAHVIRNRAADEKRWPDSIRGVILQPWQFSSFNAKDPNVSKYPDESDKSWDSCKRAVASTLPDPTNGANHYFDDSIKAPKWADPRCITAVIDSFSFYKLG